MSAISFIKRISNFFRRLRPTSDRTKTTGFALSSNDTALRNLAHTINKQRFPDQWARKPVEHCLKVSFQVPPDDNASSALKKAMERVREAATDRDK